MSEEYRRFEEAVKRLIDRLRELRARVRRG